MKKVGIILNILGIILIISFCVSYFANMNSVLEQLNSNMAVGTNDGPTSIFYTAKVSRTTILTIIALIAIFAFYIWTFFKINFTNYSFHFDLQSDAKPF